MDVPLGRWISPRAVSETENNTTTVGVYSYEVAVREMKMAKQDGFASYRCRTKTMVCSFHKGYVISPRLSFLFHSAAANYWPSLDVLWTWKEWRETWEQYSIWVKYFLASPGPRSAAVSPLFSLFLIQKQRSRQMLSTCREISYAWDYERYAESIWKALVQVCVQHKFVACLTAIWEYLGQRDVESPTSEVCASIQVEDVATTRNSHWEEYSGQQMLQSKRSAVCECTCE